MVANIEIFLHSYSPKYFNFILIYKYMFFFIMNYAHAIENNHELVICEM